MKTGRRIIFPPQTSSLAPTLQSVRLALTLICSVTRQGEAMPEHLQSTRSFIAQSQLFSMGGKELAQPFTVHALDYSANAIVFNGEK